LDVPQRTLRALAGVGDTDASRRYSAQSVRAKAAKLIRVIFFFPLFDWCCCNNESACASCARD
jgi:hypothetical protein